MGATDVVVFCHREPSVFHFHLHAVSRGLYQRRYGDILFDDLLDLLGIFKRSSPMAPYIHKAQELSEREFHSFHEGGGGFDGSFLADGVLLSCFERQSSAPACDQPHLSSLVEKLCWHCAAAGEPSDDCWRLLRTCRCRGLVRCMQRALAWSPRVDTEAQLPQQVSEGAALWDVGEMQGIASRGRPLDAPEWVEWGEPGEDTLYGAISLNDTRHSEGLGRRFGLIIDVRQWFQHGDCTVWCRLPTGNNKDCHRLTRGRWLYFNRCPTASKTFKGYCAKGRHVWEAATCGEIQLHDQGGLSGCLFIHHWDEAVCRSFSNRREEGLALVWSIERRTLDLPKERSLATLAMRIDTEVPAFPNGKIAFACAAGRHRSVVCALHAAAGHGGGRICLFSRPDTAPSVMNQLPRPCRVY